MFDPGRVADLAGGGGRIALGREYAGGVGNQLFAREHATVKVSVVRLRRRVGGVVGREVVHAPHNITNQSLDLNVN